MTAPEQAAVPVEVLKALALAWREKADEPDRGRASAIAYMIAARDLGEAIASAAPVGRFDGDAAELATLRKLRAVVSHFAETWAELLRNLPDTYQCEMNCGEAEAAADLYRALGDGETAGAIIDAHAEHDDDLDRAEHGKRDEPEDSE